MSQSMDSTTVIEVARSPFQVVLAAVVKELRPYARTRLGVLVLIDCQLRM